jgi:hypothetical protein
MAIQCAATPPRPYDCIAVMLNDPEIHSDDHGAVFITGYAEGLGKKVVLHNQKGNKNTGRKGTYFAKWRNENALRNFLPLELQFETKTFDNILDVELFLRPGDDRHTWVENMDEDVIAQLADLIIDEHRPITEEQSHEFDRLETIFDPRCRELEPERFRVPYRVRCALKDLIAARRAKIAVTEETATILSGIKAKIDEKLNWASIRQFP